VRSKRVIPSAALNRVALRDDAPALALRGIAMVQHGRTTRQYARLVSEWIAGIGPDPKLFGTHSLRRTKATLIYRRTGNLRAVQLLRGHTKIESTVRYLGIEVDDALAIAEQVDV
jgi:integrase